MEVAAQIRRLRWFPFATTAIGVAIALIIYWSLKAPHRYRLAPTDAVVIYGTIAGAVGQLFGRPFLFGTVGALIGFLLTPQPFFE